MRHVRGPQSAEARPIGAGGGLVGRQGTYLPRVLSPIFGRRGQKKFRRVTWWRRGGSRPGNARALRGCRPRTSR